MKRTRTPMHKKKGRAPIPKQRTRSKAKTKAAATAQGAGRRAKLGVDEAKRLVLELYANGTHSVETACHEAGYSRSGHQFWFESDTEYAARFTAAKGQRVEVLEDEAHRRAFSGSDVLLIFLLKAAKPERYRDNHRGDDPAKGPSAEQILEQLARERFAVKGDSTN